MDKSKVLAGTEYYKTDGMRRAGRENTSPSPVGNPGICIFCCPFCHMISLPAETFGKRLPVGVDILAAVNLVDGIGDIVDIARADLNVPAVEQVESAV